MLFEQKTDSLKIKIAEEIINSTSIWLNYVKIDKLVVLYQGDQVPNDFTDIENLEENEVVVAIMYHFNANSKTIKDILELRVETA
jgi:hypothetical protein